MKFSEISLKMTQNVSFFTFLSTPMLDDFVCKSGFTHKLKKCKYERKKFLKVDFGEEIVNS